MSHPRTIEDIEQSIKALIAEAEDVARMPVGAGASEEALDGELGEMSEMNAMSVVSEMGATSVMGEMGAVDESRLRNYLTALDGLITEEAALAFRAEFMNFTEQNNDEVMRDMIHKAVEEAAMPVIKAWVQTHLPDITRAVISETMGKIANASRDVD